MIPAYPKLYYWKITVFFFPDLFCNNQYRNPKAADIMGAGEGRSHHPLSQFRFSLLRSSPEGRGKWREGVGERGEEVKRVES